MKPVLTSDKVIPVLTTDDHEFETMNDPAVMMDDEVVTMDSETAYMDDTMIRSGKYKPVLRSE